MTTHQFPESLTDDQMVALGIDPRAPFSTCPRIPDSPLDIRCGATRIERFASGRVLVTYGYYSESAEKQRRVLGSVLLGALHGGHTRFLLRRED